MESPPDTIYVVEDDDDIRTLVAADLEANGFAVLSCANAAALDQALKANGCPDLIVLDIMMPGEDGLSVCRRLRARSDVGILMLTAKADDVDRIVGLELGADDYLPKPFNPRELLARIRAILRRRQSASGDHETGAVTRFAHLRVDRNARTVTDDAGVEIVLTSAEFDLLVCFMARPGRTLTRDQLMDWTRGRKADVFDRTIDVQLSRLRRKIERPGVPLFRTIRGQGYICIATVETDPTDAR